MLGNSIGSLLGCLLHASARWVGWLVGWLVVSHLLPVGSPLCRVSISAAPGHNYAPKMPGSTLGPHKHLFSIVPAR